jgi:hypothetical protein
MALSAADREELMKDVPTLEEYWAAHKKSQKEWEERHKKWEEEHKRSREEWERRQKKAEKEMAALRRTLAEVDKQIGGLGNSIGGLVETLIAAKLWKKFRGTPYSRLQRAYRRVPIYDENNHVRTDIDILLSDSDLCMAVEVKREPDRDDVDGHIKRMGLMRRYPPAETVGKKLIGAIAGGFVQDNVRDYAHSTGFFVFELTGETVTLAKPPEGFTPKEW